jgi:hypothetical protein
MLQTEKIFDEADEWLARVICYAMNLPPNAFVKQQNRATAGTAQEVALGRRARAHHALRRAAR